MTAAPRQLLLPDTPVRPLFVQIPFEIHVKTTLAPVARAKADAHPADKPVFPPPPVSYSEVEFKLHRQLRLCAKGYRAEPHGAIDFLALLVFTSSLHSTCFLRSGL